MIKMIKMIKMKFFSIQCKKNAKRKGIDTDRN